MGAADTGAGMLIDCDRCAVRGAGCADCVVAVLLGGPPEGVSLDDADRRALAVLAAGGLVPPLRMAASAPDDPESHVA